MHGRLIIFIPKEKEIVGNVMDEFYDEIMYGISPDYIGRRMHGEIAESIYQNFTNALSNIDTETMSVKKAMEYRMDYPVALFEGMYPTVFRSFVEYKAYCDLYGLSVEGYEWQVWDFHF